MLGIIIDAFKSIIDLLHKKDENKKVRIDTMLSERDLAERDRLVIPATLEDVRAYDTKVRRLEQTARREAMPPGITVRRRWRPRRTLWLMLAPGVIYVTYLILTRL